MFYSVQPCSSVSFMKIIIFEWNGKKVKRYEYTSQWNGDLISACLSNSEAKYLNSSLKFLTLLRLKKDFRRSDDLNFFLKRTIKILENFQSLFDFNPLMNSVFRRRKPNWTLIMKFIISKITGHIIFHCRFLSNCLF